MSSPYCPHGIPVSCPTGCPACDDVRIENHNPYNEPVEEYDQWGYPT